MPLGAVLLLFGLVPDAKRSSSAWRFARVRGFRFRFYCAPPEHPSARE
jgi:hypothetical protein